MKRILLPLLSGLCCLSLMAADFEPEYRMGFKASLRQAVNRSFYEYFEYPEIREDLVVKKRSRRQIVQYDYGEEAREGRVTVLFSVYRNGRITRIQVVKGLCPEIDREVRRAMKSVAYDLRLDGRFNDAEYIQSFYVSPDGRKRTEVQSEEKVYIKAEEPAVPQGGREGLSQFVRDHLEYPQRALENNQSGVVETNFLVDEEGYVAAGFVYCSGNSDLDREALRLVAQMPQMTPARQNGQAVKSWWTWPVVFSVRR